MPTDRCLLTIHAHPDDEASKGAGTVARYHAEGVRCVLVTCTGGEEGDVHNPALLAEGGIFAGLEPEEIKARMPEVRRDELARAAEVIGYDEVVLLGYRDSGMPDSAANAHPDAFANAPFDEAVARLAGVIRRERPQVVITYGDDQSGYPHPDHLRVHDITVPALELAADPGWAGTDAPPWAVAKLYYTIWSRARLVATHERLLAMGLESPFDEAWFSRPHHDHRITTRIDIRPWFPVRRAALLAHATQIDPASPFWFSLPDDVAAEVYPYDDWVLARSLVGPAEGNWPEGVVEDDLFAGVAAESGVPTAR